MNRYVTCHAQALLPGAVLLIACFIACNRVVVEGPQLEASPPLPEPFVGPPAPELIPFTATAYAIKGRTASGTRTRKGVVAADPQVLPLGTRIRVHDAGRYSGDYTVRDTGRLVRGRLIDIYIESRSAAKRFGRRRIRVQVLSEG